MTGLAPRRTKRANRTGISLKFDETRFAKPAQQVNHPRLEGIVNIARHIRGAQ